MRDVKRWVVVLSLDQYAWIKDTARTHNLKGNDVMRAMLERCMDDSTFTKSLGSEKWKIELQRVQEDKLRLIEKEREIKAHLQTDGRREKVIA